MIILIIVLHPHLQRAHLSIVIECVLAAPAVFTPPDPVFESQLQSGKIMMWTSYCTNVVIMVAYSGVLVAFLATFSPQMPFQDFEGLIKEPHWSLGVTPNTSHAEALMVSAE